MGTKPNEEIEFTPQMILAGMDALLEFHHEGSERLVREIVLAVLRQQRAEAESE